MNLLDARQDCIQRLGQHRPTTQLRQGVLFAMHPAAQCPRAAPAQIRHQRLLGRGVGNDPLGGVRRRGGAQVGDKVAQRVVRLVADRADDRRSAPGDLPAQRFVGERQQILHAAAATSEHDDVDLRIGVQRTQRFDDLWHGVGPLHHGAAHREPDRGPAGGCHGCDVMLGS